MDFFAACDDSSCGSLGEDSHAGLLDGQHG
jgi:hypothetical protein